MPSLGSLVIELAANTASLQSDMGRAVRIAEGAVGRITSVFGALSGIGAGAGISALAASAIEVGDNLNKAAIKAGVSGRTMSELAYVAKMADVDLQSLSTGLKFMQKNLSEAGSGSQAAANDLAALGLSVAQLKALSPDQQFELLADRINAMTDPADKARAAVALFGKAGADLLPLFSQGADGIRKAREEAQRLGIALSNDQIAKLAEADDAIKRMKASWEALSTQMVATVAPAITLVLDKITSKDDLALARAQLESLQNGYDELAKSALRAKIARLEAEQQKSMFASASSAFAKTMAPGSSAAPGYGEDAAAAKKAADEKQRIRDAQLRADVEYANASSAHRKRQNQQSLSAMYKDWDEYFKGQENLSRNAIELDNANLAVRRANTQAGLQAMYSDWDAFYQHQKQAQEGISLFAEQAARNMQSAFADFLFDPFKNGLKGMLTGFLQTIQRMVAEAAAASILKSIFGAGESGKGNGLGAAIGGFFSGLGFADGGSPPVGKASLVGERGPELFVPRSAGTIIPNGGLGGSVSISPVYNIDARGATVDLIQSLPAILEANTRRAVELARGAIRDDLSRGAFRRI